MTLIETMAAKKGAWKVEEIAEILNCSKDKIYGMVRSGSIPHFKVGSMIRFDPSEIAAWFEQQSLTIELLNLHSKRRR